MQARWGSHGDYEPIALSPSSVQEFFDFTIKAFNLSEQFRTPVFVMADEIIGHMREKIIIDDDIEIVARQMPEDKENYLPFRNVENGTNPMPSFGQGFNIHVTGLTHDERGYPSTDDADVHDDLVQRLCDKILNNRDKICSVQSKYCEDAETVLVSYGAPVRSVSEAVEKARAEGKKVGYIKIDTPWPFPEEQVKELTKTASNVLVVELNLGQMFYEVDRVLRRDSHVYLMGQIGGTMPTPDEILSKINEIGGN